MSSNTSRHGLDPCPPEKALTAICYEWGTIALESTGPRGGCTYVAIPKESRRRLAWLLLEGLDDDMPYYCRGCGRAEDNCSREPCPKVISDRGE